MLVQGLLHAGFPLVAADDIRMDDRQWGTLVEGHEALVTRRLDERFVITAVGFGDAEHVLLSHQSFQLVASDAHAFQVGRGVLLIHDDTLDEKVGYLWWGIREQHGTCTATLYFIGIFEPYRRRGYATQALRLLEEQVREAGLDEIRLYVFGHNTRAWSLYEKMGYRVVSATMAKRIEPSI